VVADPVPLWLLDIDGVVNALGATLPDDVWPADQWVQRLVVAEVPGRGLLRLPVLAARPVLEFVAAVHAARTAEIRWHSTWRAAAITSLSPALGLPAMPISIAPEWSSGRVATPGWWKLPAAQRARATGRRLVWTDDDLGAQSGHGRQQDVLALAELSASADALLLGPPARTGLRPADLDAIARFIAADR
jgi:hypothetical protein